MSLKPPVNKNDHLLGDKEASIEIVEYGDYQCPYCRESHSVMVRLMKEFEGHVKFVFRNFPLKEIHRYAAIAALGAESAAIQGKFWQMHDMIYENQERLNEPFLFTLADELQLDKKRFEADLQSAFLDARIDADLESGIRSGVNGTPTFFINGKKFDGDAADVLNLLRAALSPISEI
ncbi:DsbA family protein [Terrimonas sp. NA20]|uniref:DsbA family protein n=1 Tax=Terrimonas ginsenosidimutans TaxID=2908004 RepID=A0ABS9KUF0_9BACT|nr:DsbA family protein [Terrimonas ginsenosidimutans]MCG2615974.1 DsbA family protein [Terrimonas ginsenosidimutans]